MKCKGLSMKKIIPPEILNVAGEFFNIEYVEKLYDQFDTFGRTNYNFNEVYLSPQGMNRMKTEEQKFDVSKLNVTFLHECFHLIFKLQGREELANDEQLVDLCAQFMHQIIQQIELKEED